jgi:dihydrodipicolinate synthase/N-acetylneuraminate lyase
MPVLLAASVTPLRDGGEALDTEAIEPLVAHLEAGGVDGIFALGTTGEGVMLTPDERRRAAEAFRAACHGRLIVHCGAQTTAQTCALAAHAASIGADGVAVIPPPYYAFGTDAVVGHLAAAAAACDPVGFYPYAFTARSGYPLPAELVARLGDRVGNVAGAKVSESAWADVEPFLSLGIDVYVGSEPLIPRALAAGAAGAVSGLASAYPAEVAAVVHAPDEAAGERLRALRADLERRPFQAAIKAHLAAQGVPIRTDVRAPLPGV